MARDPDPRPVPPERPAPGDCCDSGCECCVLDAWSEEMDAWRAELAAWRARHPDVPLDAGADP